MANGRDNGGPQDLGWTDWQPLDGESNHNGPASYEMRMTTSGGNPVPIPRFLSCDDEGLLAIGETSRMEDRRRQFICGMTRCYGHSEGNLLNILIKHSPFDQCFPGYRLQFHYHPAVDKAEAQQIQERLIKQYVRKFGEVPPLNSAIPNRYGNW